MGSQRHRTAAAQRIPLIRIQRSRAASFFPQGHVTARGRCMPHCLEHHHVPRSRNRSRNRCAGRPAQKRPLHPSRSACGTSYPSSATSCSIRSTAPILRSHRPGAVHRQLILAALQAQAVPPRKPMCPCRHRAVGRSRRTRRDRQWRDGLRQDDGGHCHRRRAQRRRLPPHPGSRHPPGLQVAARNPGDGGRCQKVWVLNGPDTLVKLLKLREQLGVPAQGQEFFVLGRVRMRMGSTGNLSSFGGARLTATWGPARIAGMSSPTSTASRSTRSNSRSRGVPPQVQPLPCTAVVVDPSQRACPPATSPRPCSRH